MLHDITCRQGTKHPGWYLALHCTFVELTGLHGRYQTVKSETKIKDMVCRSQLSQDATQLMIGNTYNDFERTNCSFIGKSQLRFAPLVLTKILFLYMYRVR